MVSAFAQNSIVNSLENSVSQDSLAESFDQVLQELEIDISEQIPAKRLSIINHVLKNTQEIFIHKMRGEDDNVCYYNDQGMEVVYDKDGNIVTNDWNKGSYNYAPYSRPVDKFTMDMLPWLLWGNTRTDPTDIRERFYHYLIDLSIGCQAYIFMEKGTTLTKMKYKDLPEMDKKVYKFFEYVIFNSSYKIQLDKDVKKLMTSEDTFWEYIGQIMDIAGYEKVDE